MAPKSPWNKAKSGSKPQNTAAPSANTAGNDRISPANTTDYEQAQNDELEALQAIYMDDFEEVETKSAWSKHSDRAFRVRLRSPSDDEVSIVLSVKLTATYPKTVPSVTLQEPVGIRTKSQKSLEKLLKTKPKELLGEVMIYEIATAIQDILEDEAQFKAKGEALPSLEQERVVQEAVTTKLAKQQEEEQLRRKKEEKAEEDRALQQMVEDEMNRRRDMKRKSKAIAPDFSAQVMSHYETYMSFDRPITYQDEGNSVSFSSVTAPVNFQAGPVTTVSIVHPIMTGHDRDNIPLLVLKKMSTNHSSGQQTQAKQHILELEDELEALRNLSSHPNILRILDFRIDPVGDAWQVAVLTEHARKGSLAEMLSTFEALPPARVRAWTVELLEALDFYHRQGIVHKRIHPGNVLLSQQGTGSPMQTKLADAGFQESLYELHGSIKPTSALSARSAYWIPSEGNERKSRKTDVWDLGVLFLQMLFGLNVPQKYSGPGSLIDNSRLTSPLEDMIRKFFKPDPKKRPSAFDIIPSEFLRNDVDVYSRPSSPMHSRLPSSASMPWPDRRAMRRGSSGFLGGGFSRYANEWVEVGRLGKGGYGEVVKARNKLDGRIYAIKRIKQNSASALSEVLSEVMLLSRLNHPYVVRYYTAWPEDDFSETSETDEGTATTTVAEETSSLSPGAIVKSLDFGRSTTGGLDFISSSGFPKIEFGVSSDEESDENSYLGNDETPSNPKASNIHSAIDDTAPSSGGQNALALRRTSSSRISRPVKTTLFIQMEYCERHTLRDLIRKEMDPEEAWRLLRQVLEGLVHIHSLGIIHRDLKPDNIFIDVANNPRIGDFGLATSGQYHLADKASAAGTGMDGDMTRSVGTTFYVAPELRSSVSGTYNDKVDMYSLGIIFFEMCYPLKTAMERDKAIRAIREKQHTLPSVFEVPEKALQGSIIESLISHRPSERPSSTELLHSGKIPVKIEDETIRHALESLSDPSSPYYHQMMSALFSQTPSRQIKDYTWDLGSATGMFDAEASTLLLQSLVKERLVTVFRRHGAVETQRQLLLPRSAHYVNNNVVQLLDSSGTLVQLPYDLTLPNARAIARRYPAADRSFAFGNVFRDSFAGGAPHSNGEVDFDVVSHDTLDLALKEAEAIKVLDEIIDEFPAFASTPMCFHLNHADLLDLIMEYCRISIPQRPAVKEQLSRLNIHSWTWPKVRNELRSPTLAVPSTSLDDMARFDFRDSIDKTFAKISSIFEGTEYYGRVRGTFKHLQTVVGYLKQLGVHRKVYISPLSSFNEKFYTGGMLFQCLFDKKQRDVLAAGGRYDRLIEEHKPKVQGQFTGCHAVGFNLGWDRLVTAMARYHRNLSKPSTFLKKASSAGDTAAGAWTIRRCDVLVAAFDPTVLRTNGLKVLADLWANDISSELAVDTRSPEEISSRYRDDKHGWVVILKQDSSAGIKADVKVKNLSTRQDSEVKWENLVPHLRAELREREHREGTAERNRLQQKQSSGDYSLAGERRQNVQVLMALHRSKKSNKWNIVEAAQSRAQGMLDDYASAPIAAVEIRDDILDAIRGARLSDPESWRKVVHGAPLNERDYILDIHRLLERYKMQWEGDSEGRSRVAFIYNFRTGHVVLYDLGL